MSVTVPSAPVFILLLVLLLVFPQYATAGASDGLLLWFHTVLPTLAPAMICTQMILSTGGVSLLMRPLHPLLGRLFSLSETGSFILLSGMLCGYPLGPALCANALSKHQISEREATRLLAICSYPSPMFLFGYVQANLTRQTPPWVLFLGIYAPSILLAQILDHIGLPDQRQRTVSFASPAVPESHETLDSILYRVCDTMVLIGGYLMLFSILTCFLTHARWIPASVSAVCCGIAEMTTGVRQICQTFPPAVQLPACGACAAFGGISGLFQVRSVLYDNKNAGFDIRHYLRWKLLHAGLSAMIFTVLQQVLPR